ncbi:MAG: DNA polymerase III subunit delta [Rickettsiales bacterium]|jgi:DNA polymerase-3 subunit delta|nr:DNA polymerase III subunit delta [Rickettsiales bacterium]
MKWKEIDFNGGIGKIRALLIYGPDAGQVDEFCDRAIEKSEIQKDNLFAIDSDDLKEKQDALFSEACSLSMFGGRKMVIISNAGDSDARAISDLVGHPSLDAIVLVTAGDLRAGGGLRAFFEGGDDIAALPCYTDDAKTLAALIHKELFAAGIKQITSDALGYMTSHLGGDRGVTRSFLRKIALYVDDKKIVELDDVEKCLPDTGAADLDEFLFSLTAGHIHQTMTALDRLFYDNAEPVRLAKMLNFHFKRLMFAVVEGQMPRLFWKVADKFNQAVKIWPESEITNVLARLNELEKQLVTTGMPSEILMRDFALKLSLRCTKMSVKRRN